MSSMTHGSPQAMPGTETGERPADRLRQAAQTLDDITRSSCLLALDMALRADQPAQYGKSLTEAATDVRRLAGRTATTMDDFQRMLKVVEGGKPSAIDEALSSFCR
jgi:hypothetical protein